MLIVGWCQGHMLTLGFSWTISGKTSSQRICLTHPFPESFQRFAVLAWNMSSGLSLINIHSVFNIQWNRKMVVCVEISKCKHKIFFLTRMKLLMSAANAILGSAELLISIRLKFSVGRKAVLWNYLWCWVSVQIWFPHLDQNICLGTGRRYRQKAVVGVICLINALWFHSWSMFRCIY